MRGGRGRALALAYHRAAPSWAAADDVDDAAGALHGRGDGAGAAAMLSRERTGLGGAPRARAPPPLVAQQSLGFVLLDVAARAEIARGALPLEPGATLQWLGFGDDGALSAMDSRGALLTLSPAFGWRWACALDTVPLRRSGDDRYWPVAVRRGQLMAVTLKGGVLSPATHPRPVLTQIALAAPHASAAPAAAERALEAELGAAERARAGARARSTPRSPGPGRVRGAGRRCARRRRRRRRGAARARGRGARADEQASVVEKTLLRIVKAACGSDRLQRALDAVAQLRLPKSFAIALKIANAANQPALAERIEEIAARNAGEMDA